MRPNPKQIARTLIAGVLAALIAVPSNVLAQAAMNARVSDHVVSPADLHKAVVDATRTRDQNLASLNSYFSSDRARSALKSAHMDPEQVKTAVASLSDAELAQLASQANKSQADFAAGNLNDRDLLIILVAIAALILIIVAVR
jgi:hypothetical protein